MVCRRQMPARKNSRSMPGAKTGGEISWLGASQKIQRMNQPFLFPFFRAIEKFIFQFNADRSAIVVVVQRLENSAPGNYPMPWDGIAPGVRAVEMARPGDAVLKKAQ